MPRQVEAWVRTQFEIKKLSPADGDTIIWSEEDKLDSEGNLIGTVTIHTFVTDFVKAAKDIIEDETVDDAAVLAELKARGLVP